MTLALVKRIALPLAMLLAVTAGLVGATGAFFSDSETSTGNTLAAGDIDLGIDNHSYYNNVLNQETTWSVDYDIDTIEYLGDNPATTDVVENGYSLPGMRQFFNFLDLKPGDSGEDTISIHVKSNDAFLCADVTLTSDDDNGVNEPEGDAGDNTPGVGQGELADAVDFYWWADDGDNVYECVMIDHDENTQTPMICNPQAVGSERLLPAGPLGALSVGQTATVDLADANDNIWTGQGGALPGNQTVYIGKAWCFGNSTFAPYAQDGLGYTLTNGPDDGRPVVCDGSQEGNITQTDSLTANISFRAVQSRHNATFECFSPIL